MTQHTEKRKKHEPPLRRKKANQVLRKSENILLRLSSNVIWYRQINKVLAVPVQFNGIIFFLFVLCKEQQTRIFSSILMYQSMYLKLIFSISRSWRNWILTHDVYISTSWILSEVTIVCSDTTCCDINKTLLWVTTSAFY